MRQIRADRGFTLIELMVVVTILGVLTVLAVNGYRVYMRDARTAEAVNFLGGLRASQESYYQNYGQYCGDPGAWAAHPEDDPSDSPLTWSPINNEAWLHLGAEPPAGTVWFQYRFKAGTADDVPPAEAFKENDSGKPWYQIQALSDFDSNGTQGIYEVTSRSPTPFQVSEDQ